MTKLTSYRNNEFGEIRVAIIDYSPWFIGEDVCRAFGDTNSKEVLKKIDEEDKRSLHISDQDDSEKMTFINVFGLHRLFFTMRPQDAENNPDIEERVEKLCRLKLWLMTEVLPVARKSADNIYYEDLIINTYFSEVSDEQKTVLRSTLRKITSVQNEKNTFEEQKKKIIDELVANPDLAIAVLTEMKKERENAGYN